MHTVTVYSPAAAAPKKTATKAVAAGIVGDLPVGYADLRKRQLATVGKKAKAGLVGGTLHGNIGYYLSFDQSIAPGERSTTVVFSEIAPMSSPGFTPHALKEVVERLKGERAIFLRSYEQVVDVQIHSTHRDSRVGTLLVPLYLFPHVGDGEALQDRFG